MARQTLLITVKVAFIITILMVSAGIFFVNDWLWINPHLIPVALIGYVGFLCFVFGIVFQWYRNPSMIFWGGFMPWRAWKDQTKLEATLFWGGWLLMVLAIALGGLISELFGYWYSNSGDPVFLPGKYF